MANHDVTVTHIALRVRDLRNAERYYCKLFGLEVGFREAPTPDGWCALPPGKTWADAEGAGIDLKLSVLYRGSFVLALDAQEQVNENGRLSHIGLQLPDRWLEWIRKSALEMRCQIELDLETVVIFRDAEEVLWECSTFPYVGDQSMRPMSSGESGGRWLKL